MAFPRVSTGAPYRVGACAVTADTSPVRRAWTVVPSVAAMGEITAAQVRSEVKAWVTDAWDPEVTVQE